MATRKVAGLLERSSGLPDTFWYTTKRRLLGPPLVNQDLGEQRLSKPLALGVLSPDGISSSAYGTEEILIVLVPALGIAAFSLILPMTLVILFVMVLVLLSYREIVMVYIRPGGSYVVARENFGPRIAQVCAVALLIDYVVTVAVQIAAGTAAVASAFPGIGPYKLEICVGVVLLMCVGNLRGIKEAGRAFAVPTYLFSGAVILMIIVGLIREVLGNLPKPDPHALPGTYSSRLRLGRADHRRDDLHPAASAFANGGASLTGIEAVSDAVGAFRPPEGRNARQVLMAEGAILGVLVAGISWLAHATHATPYKLGYPTVLAQEAKLVFGPTFVGQALFYLVQAATMLILYTGGNTSFNGFPFLTSYVAGDSFLPRWLLKRGHRLVFSNAIILLTITSAALLIIKDADVNNLVPLYAIGVFTAFSMAGFGMARYHSRHRTPGWRHRMIINFSAGVMTVIVVAIFAVVKFTEGAWVVRRAVRRPGPGADQDEPRVLGRDRGPRDDQREPAAARAALQPPHRLRLRGRLRPGHPGRAALRPEPAAHHHPRGALRHRQRPRRQAQGQVDPGRPRRHPGLHRRLRPPADPGGRRAGRARGGRSRHARDRGAAPAKLLRAARPAAARPHRGQDRRRGEPHPAVGRDHHSLRRREPRPGAAGTPGRQGRGHRPGHRRLARQVRGSGRGGQSRLRRRTRARGFTGPRGARARIGPEGERPAQGADAQRPTASARPTRTPQAAGVTPIGSLRQPGRATVEGRVRVVEIKPVERNSVLACEISDGTGELTAMFYGRSHIPGIVCSARVRFKGSVGIKADGHPVMINPAYELLFPAV